MNLLVFQNETFFSQSIIIEGSEKLLPQAVLNILNKFKNKLSQQNFFSKYAIYFISKC